jgi:hypothetical protein
MMENNFSIAPCRDAKMRVPLAHETRHAVDTATAAYYLNRSPQTLRIWACRESGPLRPVRVHGRLAWPTADIARVMGGRHE